MSNARETRVQAIVIQNGRVLFGYGKRYHLFVGGGVEQGETPEQAALRELREEANVNGTILCRIREPASPGRLASAYRTHATFLVDIQDQTPFLVHDPEETDTGDQISLAGIELIPLDRTESFTGIDTEYFRSLLAECLRRGLDYPWCEAMRHLVGEKRQK